MTDSGEERDVSEGSRTSPRRLLAWTVGVTAALALFVYVPGPVATVLHKRDAAQLVDQVADQRTAALQRAETARSALAPLGSPVRSWSSVNCEVRPRYSDGDGEQGVVVRYQQACEPMVREIYALPSGRSTVADAAALLKGRLSESERTCDEPIYDVLDLRLGEIDADGYAMALRWVGRQGKSSHGDVSCALPVPNDDGATRVEMIVDEPLTADAYVVFSVFGETVLSNIGCERSVGWLGSCTDPPEGAPYL